MKACIIYHATLFYSYPFIERFSLFKVINNHLIAGYGFGFSEKNDWVKIDKYESKGEMRLLAVQKSFFWGGEFFKRFQERQEEIFF